MLQEGQGEVDLFWNMFAFPLSIGDRKYAFLTDTRSVVEISDDVYEALNALDIGLQPIGAEARALFDLGEMTKIGLLRNAARAGQFREVMKPAPASERELLHIITSYACNLSCSYCFMLSELDKHESKVLTFEEAKRGIDLYFSEPHRADSVVHFYGGEPLLHQSLVESCLSYITSRFSRDIVPKIITNGTIHDAGTIDLLRRYPFDISVSIDGDREAHDAFRLDHMGRSSYDSTVDGVRAFQSAGLNCKILITVGQHNIDRLPEVVDSVLDLSPYAIALNYPRALPTMDNGIECEGEEARFWVGQYLKALQRCYERKIPELYFADMLFALLTGEPALRPCAACGAQLSVGPNGVVGPCQAFVAAGKFSQKIEAYRPDAVAGPFSAWVKVSKASSRKCSACSISPICGGDCSFDRFNRLKSLHEPMALHCEMRLAMAKEIGTRLISNQPLGFAQEFDRDFGDQGRAAGEF